MGRDFLTNRWVLGGVAFLIVFAVNETEQAADVPAESMTPTVEKPLSRLSIGEPPCVFF